MITDSSKKPTTGKITKYDAQPFAVTTTTGSVGANGDVNVTVKATRTVQIEAEITSGSGKTNNVVWSQNLEFSNLQQYLQDTFIQVFVQITHAIKDILMKIFSFVQNVFQTASGSVLSTHNGVAAVKDDFSYPLNILFTVLADTAEVANSTCSHLCHSLKR